MYLSAVLWVNLILFEGCRIIRAGDENICKRTFQEAGLERLRRHKPRSFPWGKCWRKAVRTGSLKVALPSSLRKANTISFPFTPQHPQSGLKYFMARRKHLKLPGTIWNMRALQLPAALRAIQSRENSIPNRGWGIKGLLYSSGHIKAYFFCNQREKLFKKNKLTQDLRNVWTQSLTEVKDASRFLDCLCLDSA